MSVVRKEIVSSVDDSETIEVVDEANGLYARIRVRERALKIKASVFLSPDELTEFATACLTLAADMRNRR